MHKIQKVQPLDGHFVCGLLLALMCDTNDMFSDDEKLPMLSQCMISAACYSQKYTFG